MEQVIQVVVPLIFVTVLWAIPIGILILIVRALREKDPRKAEVRDVIE